MRFEELSYREDGHPVSVPFHPRLTVVGPLGSRARAGWITRVLGALLGTRAGDGTALTFAGQAGRRFRLERDEHGAARLTGTGTAEDFTPAAADLPLDGRFDWFASVGLDSASAETLIRVVPTDFKGGDFDPWEAEDELVEVREVLARLDAEYEAVVGRCRHAEELYRRVGELDEWLGRLEDERARRRHAEALRTVRRLEAAVTVLRRTVDAEQRKAEAILAAAHAAEEWRRAAGALELARLACGDDQPVGPEPAGPPAAPAGAEGPGAGAGVGDGRLAEELEVAHRALEEAERELDGARLPGAAMIARRHLARADRREQAVLTQMGFSSWLAFQMQRVEVLRTRDDGIVPAPGDIPDPGPTVDAPDPEVARAARAAIRMRRTLAEAASACRTAQERLEGLLASAGLLPDEGLAGDPEALTAALAAPAREAAVHRRTPPSGATLQRTEADLAEARAALAAHGRPEPDEVPDVAEAPLPDPEPLLAERARLFEQAYRMERDLPDVGRLQDEREVLAGHIATLETASRLGYRLPSVEEAEMVLLGRVAEARHGGGPGAPLPLLVDDAFAAFPDGDRGDLLDLLCRLAETTQIVYLTGHTPTLEWSAGRDGSELGVIGVAPPGPSVASVA
jgi:hypothetical protein